MKVHPHARHHRMLLCHAIGLALASVSFAAQSRVLYRGEVYTLVAGTTPEAWTASGENVFTLQPGASTLSVSLLHSTLNAADASIVSSGAGTSDTALRVFNGSTATITGGSIRSVNGTALLVTGDGSAFSDIPATASVNGTAISGGGLGVVVAAGSAFTSAGRSTIDGTGVAGIGLRVSNGTAELTDGSRVTGTVYGISMLGDPRGGGLGDTGRHLVVDGSTVVGLTGAAVFVQPLVRGVTDADIVVRNGSSLVGGNGIAIDVGQLMNAAIDISGSAITGDIQTGNGASANVVLGPQADFRGAMHGVVANGVVGAGNIAIAVEPTASWRITGDSHIASLALNGTAAFEAAGDGSHRTLTVDGDFSGQDGRLGFNAQLNEGGALNRQFTDRLLIGGNVTTTGTALVTVTPSGDGAITDTNHNGVVDAGEGLSIIQVGGASRADAFALAGGYVAAGPYQYTLHAFGPGEVDQTQSALGSGTLTWDYRLGNRYVCQNDCPPVDPGGPGPGDGGEPGTPENPGDGTGPVAPPPQERIAVVPQLPSYLSAPAALLTYGDMMNDGLHQRLGDIRQSTSTDPVGGEMFARYLGGQLRYSSNLSFQRYGYDFDQQINALQLGGSLIALDGDNGSLRAGWAADKGTTRVTPEAADGNSSAKYHANGVSGWITWQQGNGFWVDGVIGATRYRGDVGTDLRSSDVGNVRAHGWTTSVEAGLPIAIGGDWTVEPRFQLKHQQLNFRDFTDEDGLAVQLGTAKQTSATLGGRITRTAQPHFMPYASLDLTHTSNGDPMLDVSSETFNASDRFGSGRVGNSYRVAAGAVSQLGEHVQLYGEGTYQHFVGSYGMRGWAGNLGIRVSF